MLQLAGKIAMWAADVTVLSLILALIEIVLEKDQGWASTLNQRGWGRKFLEGTPLVRWIDKPYVTAYHLLVFGALLPIALWTQYRIGVLAAFGSTAHTSHAVADGLFLFSAYLAICVFEDFLWFALNWYYPSSLTDLLAGEIWWHTGWVAVGRAARLPRVYLSVGAIALGLLAVSLALAK
jgi:hypothetical protein